MVRVEDVFKCCQVSMKGRNLVRNHHGDTSPSSLAAGAARWTTPKVSSRTSPALVSGGCGWSSCDLETQMTCCPVGWSPWGRVGEPLRLCQCRGNSECRTHCHHLQPCEHTPPCELRLSTGQHSPRTIHMVAPHAAGTQRRESLTNKSSMSHSIIKMHLHTRVCISLDHCAH